MFGFSSSGEGAGKDTTFLTFWSAESQTANYAYLHNCLPLSSLKLSASWHCEGYTRSCCFFYFCSPWKFVCFFIYYKIICNLSGKCSQIAAWLYHLPASVAYHLLASVTWHLKTSKTDQERKGADIYMYVGKTGDILCPVAALLAYSAVRGALPGPLFQLQDRTLDKRLLHTEVQSSFWPISALRHLNILDTALELALPQQPLKRA